ncbi:cupin domain-containing protein [Aureivirga sp. CE67]|uniref:cupin domain-containing protein n=1 Tax=Aureivirga sp. CE67 TaxID=1788983 RepID=UPI0018C990A0|nr:cupin domain-containing protein [Aureivirga sp. CE67]
MINLIDKLETVESYFSPKVVGEVNNQYIKVAKILGEDIPWHNHENEDESFFILEGELLMEIENEKPFVMRKGDLYVVKKEVNHRVSSKKECKIMLIESKTTEHTGKVKTAITKSLEDQL